MNEILLARIYLTEGQHLHRKVMQHLHDVEKVKGVTMFRAISGYGGSGIVHQSTLVDLSLDLPLVIEFFDTPEKVRQAIDGLDGLVEADHVITFAGNSY